MNIFISSSSSHTRNLKYRITRGLYTRLNGFENTYSIRKYNFSKKYDCEFIPQFLPVIQFLNKKIFTQELPQMISIPFLSLFFFFINSLTMFFSKKKKRTKLVTRKKFLNSS